MRKPSDDKPTSKDDTRLEQIKSAVSDPKDKDKGSKTTRARSLAAASESQNPLSHIQLSEYESQGTWREGRSKSALLAPARNAKTITVDGIEQLIMNMCVNLAKNNEDDYDRYYRKLYKHQKHIHFTQSPRHNESRILSQLAL